MNGLDDFVTRRDGLPYPVAGPKLEILHQREHQRVGHHHSEDVLLDGHGDAVARQRDVFGDQGNCGGVWGRFGQIDVRKPELIGQRLGNLALGRQAHPDEHRPQALAGSFVLDQRQL